jgi:hypothetical protein
MSKIAWSLATTIAKFYWKPAIWFIELKYKLNLIRIKERCIKKQINRERWIKLKLKLIIIKYL